LFRTPRRWENAEITSKALGVSEYQQNTSEPSCEKRGCFAAWQAKHTKEIDMADPSEIIKLVNEGAKGLWEIVKDGQPSTSAQTKYIQVMPSKTQVDWEELGGWKTKTIDWTFQAYSIADQWFDWDPSIDLALHLEFQYGGQTNKAKGLFLNNFVVWCVKAHADWGWHVNVNASTTGNPVNLKSPQDPVGSIQLLVQLDFNTVRRSGSQTWGVTAGADGSLKAQPQNATYKA
jgi:hypothetical protein